MIGAFCFLDWQAFQPPLSVLALNKFWGHFTYPPQPVNLKFQYYDAWTKDFSNGGRANELKGNLSLATRDWSPLKASVMASCWRMDLKMPIKNANHRTPSRWSLLIRCQGFDTVPSGCWKNFEYDKGNLLKRNKVLIPLHNKLQS